MTEPIFDIFAGTSDQNAIWLEAVPGLSNARERMEQIAAQTPGQYFVFSSASHAIMARIETFQKPASELNVTPQHRKAIGGNVAES